MRHFPSQAVDWVHILIRHFVLYWAKVKTQQYKICFPVYLDTEKLLKVFGLYFPDIWLTSSAKFVSLILLISKLCILKRFKLYSAKLANAYAQIKFSWLIRSCRISDAINTPKISVFQECFPKRSNSFVKNLLHFLIFWCPYYRFMQYDWVWSPPFKFLMAETGRNVNSKYAHEKLTTNRIWMTFLFSPLVPVVNLLLLRDSLVL